MFYCIATIELFQLCTTWERYYCGMPWLLEAEMQILGSYSQTQTLKIKDEMQQANLSYVKAKQPANSSYVDLNIYEPAEKCYVVRLKPN